MHQGKNLCPCGVHILLAMGRRQAIKMSTYPAKYKVLGAMQKQSKKGERLGRREVDAFSGRVS